jgi:hypothetical protein
VDGGAVDAGLFGGGGDGAAFDDGGEGGTLGDGEMARRPGRGGGGGEEDTGHIWSKKHV